MNMDMVKKKLKLIALKRKGYYFSLKKTYIEYFIKIFREISYRSSHLHQIKTERVHQPYVEIDNTRK